MKNGQLPRRSNKRPAKRGLVPRILLMLADGKPHCLSEFWDYVVSGIEPQAAARAYQRRFKARTSVDKATRIMREQPQQAVEEGTRLMVLTCLWSMEKEGYVVVSYPDPVVRDVKGTRGYINVRNATATLTPTGYDHMLNGGGMWGKVYAELYLALKQHRVTLEVKQRSPI